jgi:prephenate dehydrogenase
VGTLAILGVGLIGGSYGLAAKARGLCSHVVGWVRSPGTADAAVGLGAVDEATYDLGRAVSRAETIVLCTPPAMMPALCQQVRPLAPRGAVVTDAASVKGRLVPECEDALGPGIGFVGGHPMAGSERAGVANAREDLFVGAHYVLTPTPRTQTWALRSVEEFARRLGAHVLRMSPEDHDAAVARASHLPHIAASAVAQVAIASSRARAVHGAGLRDTTRVAAGDAQLWAEILSANAEALREPLGETISRLSELSRLLALGEQEAVREWLELGAALRRSLDAGEGAEL